MRRFNQRDHFILPRGKRKIVTTCTDPRMKSPAERARWCYLATIRALSAVPSTLSGKWLWTAAVSSPGCGQWSAGLRRKALPVAVFYVKLAVVIHVAVAA
jgi:hypothetical protein